eukprot:scaffold22740_cov139-Cylindrotheca_fusiformis.AAC.6
MGSSTEAPRKRTIKVAGLGHSLTLETDGSTTTTTIGDLKREIERLTNIPAMYQHLLARGKKLDMDQLTLEEAGIEDRTKIMLLHNAAYASEKGGYDVLARLQREIADLEAKKEETPSHVTSELVTRICCKLDAVDIQGSENLRALRKQLLRRAEGIDHHQ